MLNFLAALVVFTLLGRLVGEFLGSVPTRTISDALVVLGIVPAILLLGSLAVLTMRALGLG